MPSMKIHNFVTESWEDLPEGMIPEDRGHEFLPQHPAAQNLYRLYLEMGERPLIAMLKVLEACTGHREGERETQTRVLHEADAKLDDSTTNFFYDLP